MNKLFIIGNGFDLAHGLKTKYSDFLLWYLQKALNILSINGSYSDDLLTLSYDVNSGESIINSIREFKDLISKRHIKVSYSHEFFRSILDKHIDTNWEDIEYYYFKVLLQLYSFSENHFFKADYSIDIEVKKLNDCLNHIKEQLVEYLKTIETSNKKLNDRVFSHFSNEIKSLLIQNNIANRMDKIMFLIFNYTSTINLYSNIFSVGHFEINFIHGKLNDENNPIIFGYGDESDTFYEKIERLNSNEFLKPLIIRIFQVS
jgi:hypothetical protein